MGSHDPGNCVKINIRTVARGHLGSNLVKYVLVVFQVIVRSVPNIVSAGSISIRDKFIEPSVPTCIGHGSSNLATVGVQSIQLSRCCNNCIVENKLCANT